MSFITYQDVRHFKCNGLRRWKAALRNGISIRLHHWVKGDPPEYQHAHPWNFFTLVLTGGYDDIGKGRATDHVRAPTVRYRPHTWRHSVINTLPGTWTIVVTGRIVRPWRFWIGDTSVSEEQWNLRPCD